MIIIGIMSSEYQNCLCFRTIKTFIYIQIIYCFYRCFDFAIISGITKTLSLLLKVHSMFVIVSYFKNKNRAITVIAQAVVTIIIQPGETNSREILRHVYIDNEKCLPMSDKRECDV